MAGTAVESKTYSALELTPRLPATILYQFVRKELAALGAKL